MARLARILLYCLIAWLPLPLGSNRPVFWLINSFWASAILLLFLVGEFRRTRHLNFNWRPTAWALSALGIWVVWMIVQAWPNANFVFASIQPTIFDRLPIPPVTVSINPSATWTTIVQIVPAILLSVVAVGLAADRRRARFLLNVIIVTTVTVAAYGLLADYSGIQEVFLIDTTAYEGYLTGTFVGRNAAATYFMIGLAGSAAMILVALDDEPSAEAASFWRRIPGDFMSLGSVVPYLVAFMILSVAVFNTGSRGGVVAGIFALLSVVILSARGGSVSGSISRGAIGIGLVLTLMIFALSSNTIIDRFKTDLWSDGRLEVYQDTIGMIMARPLVGFGAGTFADAFPAFHELAPTSAAWNRAHNTYLQMAAEIGLPVFFIVIATVACVLIYLIKALKKQAAKSPVIIAAIGATLGAAIHSIIDFSVQFQAVGMTLSVLLGAAVGEASAASRRRESPVNRTPILSPTSTISTEKVRVRLPLQTKNSASSVIDPAIPDGLRVYVFGDLHGRFDLLLHLREAIKQDRERAPSERCLVVGIGDYIDRGPQSRDVIEALVSGFFSCESIYLRGNHEQMLLDFLEDPVRSGPVWIRNGASETLRSYTLDESGRLPTISTPFAQIRSQLAECIPPSHILFLQKLPTSYQCGSYFFAHAGARSGVPLQHQDPHDLLWIRDGFTDHDDAFEKIIVHGHTPVDRAYFGKYRIAIDTGAYFTNLLTCLVLEGQNHRVLEIKADLEADSEV